MRALFTSAERRLGQYSQSYAHSLLIRILRREIHLPSGVKEWHIPPTEAFPSPPFVFARFEPEEEHDTSYLALSVKICKVSALSICVSRLQMPARAVRHKPEITAAHLANICLNVLYHPKNRLSNICLILKEKIFAGFYGSGRGRIGRGCTYCMQRRLRGRNIFAR